MLSETQLTMDVMAQMRTGIAILLLLQYSGCATETSRALDVPSQPAADQTAAGPRQSVVIGKFENRSAFLRGVFSDGNDRLGGQARSILVAHLDQSGRFAVVDRENLEELKREAALSGQGQRLKAGEYALTGAVTEFGRKEVGDTQLFGVLGSGKTQVAYAKVTLHVVNVSTSEVVASVQGAGEFSLSRRDVLGFGGSAGYDSTLNGKVLDLAIRQAVDTLVQSFEAGKWRRES